MRSQFLTDKNNSKEEMDYLRSIKLEAKLINISKDNIDRAAQLTMKTNQFNLRTIRYTQQEIIAINKNKKNIVSLVSLNDIYGDHGIIALIIVKNLENNDYFLDTFLMSCRVLGRKLETWIFRELLRILEKRKAKTLYAEYIDSKKNNLVKDLLEKHNFEKIKNTSKLNFLNNNNNHCYKKSVKKVNYGDAEIYDG